MAKKNKEKDFYIETTNDPLICERCSDYVDSGCVVNWGKNRKEYICYECKDKMLS